MDNQIQTEASELTLDELRKVTWDYNREDVVGLYDGKPIPGYMFKVKNPGDIHPLTIQRCNVDEGWIEYIVCEFYPDIEDAAEFFTEAHPKRDEMEELVIARVNCEVIVEIIRFWPEDNIILTLRKE